MKNKFLYIAVNFFIFVSSLSAQSSSIYSSFGLGDLDYAYSVRRMGMGQLGTSVADADFVSIINPASLYRIGKTRIEFSLNYNGTFLADNAQKKYYAETDFGGFAIGIPISSKYGVGVSLGIVPYTNVSYKIVDDIVSGNPLVGNYKVEYNGKGGLSKAFFSSSYSTPIDFIIGASFDYYFGNISHLSNIDFGNTSSFSSEYEQNYQYRGVGTTLGFISPDIAKLLELKSFSDFRLGLSANLFSNLTNDSVFTAKSFIELDTLISGRGETIIPAKISLGLSFVLNNKYLFCIDYATQAWSQFKTNNQTSAQLRDAYKLSAGFEYRPLRELGSTFWEQIILRAGLSYEQSQYFINGRGINQYSASLGASLPMGSENTLDFALTYSRRGTKEANLLQEDIIKFGVGFSLGELWFLRQEK